MTRRIVVMAIVSLLGSCARGTDRTDGAAQADSGMAAMPGMGAMASAAMMDSMDAHMRGMDTASSASLQASMPMHRQMTANLVAQMSSEMRGMNMTGDARWTALLDSVRQDLVRMPDLGAPQMKAFMTEHRARVERLMQSHRGMMKGMKM